MGRLRTQAQVHQHSMQLDQHCADRGQESSSRQCLELDGVGVEAAPRADLEVLDQHRALRELADLAQTPAAPRQCLELDGIKAGRCWPGDQA
ncbi:UNVERIFIED_CONTAM: hypothetical protein Slati_3045200 [Sesamum latifolium]|uniref:Uncharacterized protein n=1 Tax=Sesamum latifolium TaxID=2727402 RepID=A0AAW2UTM0_9LAMI